jgi:GntR family transcriptional regulator, transcriptional repressor for pyruvate dehydrogenase complex
MRFDAQNPFQPVHKTRLSREVEAQIRGLIAGGQATSGDRLPSERVLADALGVGRSTLREALQFLRVSGLLDVRPGAGIFVAAPALLRSLGSDLTAAGSTAAAARTSAANHRTLRP